MPAVNPSALEPELDEVIADPIIRLLMQRDGVTVEQLLPLLAQTSRKLQSAEVA